MPIVAERGYVIPAFNNETTDYEACAERLADSIRRWHPNANITILRNEDLYNPNVTGFATDWQVYRLSPYRQTIKLEADMLVTSSIDHWWTMLEHRDVVVSTGCRNYYDQPATSRFYRKLFDNNNLPDVYNAVTYWRLSQTAHEFWSWVRNIFEQWDDFKTLLKFPDDEPTTDVVYAVAAVIMGPETVTMPWATYPKIVHMKQHIIGTQGPNWTQELVWERTEKGLRIGTIEQQGCFHYHVKDWNPDEQR